MSQFARGIQSAIFYYLSCAPCYELAYRRKRKKEAKRSRLEKEALEAEQPDLYRHPVPSEQNPYWNEEILLGPGPPPRRSRKKTVDGSQRGITTAGTLSSVGSNAASSLDMTSIDGARPLGLQGMSEDTLSGDTWNSRKWQREDELLWGLGELERVGSGRQKSIGGSSVGYSGLSRPGTAFSSADSYYTYRAPPVNDLHPPIVSTPSRTAAENRWMLQPPPSAKIMNGKERANARSRSTSGASSRVDIRIDSSQSLPRQISQRRLAEKLSQGESPEMPPLSRGSTRSQNGARGQRHDRPKQIKIALGSSPETRSISSFKKRRPPPIAIADDASSSTDSSVSKPEFAPIKSESRNQSRTSTLRPNASRTQLSTIASSGEASVKSENISPHPNPETTAPTQSGAAASKTSHKSSLSRSNTTPAGNRPALAPKDNSLNVLQELVSPRELLNSRFVRAPAVEARIRLPPADSKEELQLQGTPHLDPTDPGSEDEIPPLRDPRMRWSMDF